MTIEFYKYIYNKFIYKPVGKNFTFHIENFNTNYMNNIVDKYKQPAMLLSSTWLPSDIHEKVINSLQKSNKIYFGFMLLYKILYLKKIKYYDNDYDFIGNSL